MKVFPESHERSLWSLPGCPAVQHSPFHSSLRQWQFQAIYIYFILLFFKNYVRPCRLQFFILIFKFCRLSVISSLKFVTQCKSPLTIVFVPAGAERPRPRCGTYWTPTTPAHRSSTTSTRARPGPTRPTSPTTTAKKRWVGGAGLGCVCSNSQTPDYVTCQGEGNHTLSTPIFVMCVYGAMPFVIGMTFRKILLNISN